MPRLALIAGLALVASFAGSAQTGGPPQGEWQSFSGTLTATGRRDTLPQEDGGVAATMRLTGSLVITAGAGLRRGFRVEAIGFEESQGNGMGRAVWTDDDGDRIYSRMVGSPVEAGRRSAATITGGTGRYAGVAGSYTFTWQYVLPGEQGVVQARAVSLSGRYRRESPR
jgi:hypothetical protein